MKIITEDPEDHFLQFLETFSQRERSDQQGLLIQYYDLFNARARLNDTIDFVKPGQ